MTTTLLIVAGLFAAPWQTPSTASGLQSLYVGDDARAVTEWRETCSKVMAQEEPEFGDLGTVYRLRNGQWAVVSRAVFDPQFMRRRTALFKDIGSVAARGQNVVDIAGAEDGVRGAILNVFDGSLNRRAIAAVRKPEAQVSLGLSLTFEIESPKGKRTVYSNPDTDRLETTRPVKVGREEVESTSLPKGQSDSGRRWSSLEQAQVHFHRMGTVVEQFAAVSELFEILHKESEPLAREMMAAAQALNDSLRSALKVDVRGTSISQPFNEASPTAQRLIRDQLRAERWTVEGMTLDESLALSQIAKVSVIPTVSIAVEVDGQVTVVTVGIGFW